MPGRAHQYDFAVAGGGLAGFCAALAAARLGADVCLVQDRPVFGGNSSSELRVTPRGAAMFHAYARETGIISELLIEQRSRSMHESITQGWTRPVFDLLMYEIAQREPRLTFHLSTSVEAVRLAGIAEPVSATPGPATTAAGYLARERVHDAPVTIEAIVARPEGSADPLEIPAALFLDATGDAVVAHLAGCAWRQGAEGRDEHGEAQAPAVGSTGTLVPSVAIRARDVGRPVPCELPSWATRYADASAFIDPGRSLAGREGGVWWSEIGLPADLAHGAEGGPVPVDRLTAHAMGVWHWLKTGADAATRRDLANHVLDWVGPVPGRRESRRVVGLHVLTSEQIRAGYPFGDEVAFGGWFADLPEADGATGVAPTRKHGRDADADAIAPYAIPMRSLIARDASNLLLAGRGISATHAALGSLRVMPTTALMGQACGTAAAVCVREKLPLHALPTDGVGRVQQLLLREGCFLTTVCNRDDDDLARRASVSASSSDRSRGVPRASTSLVPGMFREDDRVRCPGVPLGRRAAQWLATDGRIEAVEVCLSNGDTGTREVRAELWRVSGLWEYGVPPAPGAEPLAAGTLAVRPGAGRWVRWDLGLGAVPAGYVRLDLIASGPGDGAVHWLASGEPTFGHAAGISIAPDRLSRWRGGESLAFRIEPSQHVFEPRNVISGSPRPHRATNVWRADPDDEREDHWLELRWPTRVHVAQVELTFPAYLLRDHAETEGFYRDPACPRDYRVDAFAADGWRTVVSVHDNFHRHRRHTLRAGLRTDALRVTVTATTGGGAPSIGEVRVYGPGLTLPDR